MSIALIKDSRLFAKTINIPLGISHGEVASLVENEVESSPLWAGEKSVCAYMRFADTALTYEGTLETAFADIDNNALLDSKLVIATSALLSAFELDGVCVVEFNESISVANFENGNITAFAACDIHFDKAKSIANALSLAGLSGVHAKYYKLLSVFCKYRNVKIELQQFDAQGNALQTLTSTRKVSFFASAELRNDAELKNARQSKTRKVVKKLSVFAFCGFFAYLCFWQISNVLKSSEIKSMQEYYNSIAPTATKVEAKSAEISRLASLTNKKMRPIETIASINAVRPDSIIFARVSLEASGKISIEGTSDSIASVKEFVDAINNSGEFSAEMNVDTISGNTRFNINVTQAKK